VPTLPSGLKSGSCLRLVPRSDLRFVGTIFAEGPAEEVASRSGEPATVYAGDDGALAVGAGESA
jgi:hypothetical protein